MGHDVGEGSPQRLRSKTCKAAWCACSLARYPASTPVIWTVSRQDAKYARIETPGCFPLSGASWFDS
ncbi:hypothetical protein SBA2_270031 [Acidobacteriia bacterium SbA2]|nr:hypothetical protein SBA2_270031 [Acidobacteriia bacterium SbA2]